MKTQIKRHAMIFVFACAVLVSCSAQTKNQNGEKVMNDEEKSVLAVYNAIMDAMVAKDRAVLEKYYAPDLIFTHMSGKKQTREEFFDDIVNGKLNYYKITTHKADVSVNGDTATVDYRHTIDALAYGARGAWTFNGTMFLRKINGDWVVSRR